MPGTGRIARRLFQESSSRMISLFRKHIAPLSFSTGIFACLCLMAGATAQAQVATRTQLSAERDGGGTLNLTAKVGGAAGESVSEGSVSFETTRGSLGSVFVHDGTATLSLTNAPDWAKNVTAVYHGDAAFANSDASTAIPQQAGGLPGFTVTASPSSVTVNSGQYANVNLTITSQNGFSGAVNLSCSNLPPASTCNFNPLVATPPANGSVLSAMQITTQARSGVGLNQPELGGRSRAVYAILIPGVLVLAGIGALRRKNWGALRILGVVMLLGAATMGLTACNIRYNYLNYQPSPNFGTRPGNFTVVVSAYSSNGTAITQATSTDPNCSGAVCVALTVK